MLPARKRQLASAWEPVRTFLSGIRIYGHTESKCHTQAWRRGKGL